jgi:hypothetical protein
MKLILFISMALMPYLVNALQRIEGFDTLIWSQSDRTGVNITRLEIKPMPMVPSTETKPSQHTITFGAVFRRDLSGVLFVNLAVKACTPRGLLCVPVPW